MSRFWRLRSGNALQRRGKLGRDEGGLLMGRLGVRRMEHCWVGKIYCVVECSEVIVLEFLVFFFLFFLF